MVLFRAPEILLTSPTIPSWSDNEMASPGSLLSSFSISSFSRVPRVSLSLPHSRSCSHSFSIPPSPIVSIADVRLFHLERLSPPIRYSQSPSYSHCVLGRGKLHLSAARDFDVFSRLLIRANNVYPMLIFPVLVETLPGIRSRSLRKHLSLVLKSCSGSSTLKRVSNPVG